MRDEDVLATLEAEKLVFAVFRSRASSAEVHFRLVEPTEHSSFRVKVAHGDRWKFGVSLRSPPVAFEFSFRRVSPVIGLPDVVVLRLTTGAIPLLGWPFVTPWADVHYGLHNESYR